MQLAAGVGFIALCWLADRLHNQLLWHRAEGRRVRASVLYGREPGKTQVAGPVTLLMLALTLAWWCR